MSFHVEHVSKSFGEISALSDISFNTSEGELFGLIGPDGAGKSTLFRILVTLLLSDGGNASVAGLDVRKDYRKIRQIMGYMAGRFSLYHDLSVKENLQFYATVFGTTIEENYDLVRDVYAHLEPFSNRLAGRLSGGMKQKLALSCALIHRPKVLVLDEPTTGVDAVSRKEFWDLLKKIQKEGLTILVSTPYMDEAALCDRVGLLQDGKMLAVSDPAKLTLRDGTRLFTFRSSGPIYKYLGRIRERAADASAWLFGDEIHVLAGPRSNMDRLGEEMKQWAVPGLEWKENAPGVEDYFMQLMAKEQDDGEKQ
jgi:ABC-2 type transport system ATP-binding protein